MLDKLKVDYDQNDFDQEVVMEFLSHPDELLEACLYQVQLIRVFSDLIYAQALNYAAIHKESYKEEKARDRKSRFNFYCYIRRQQRQVSPGIHWRMTVLPSIANTVTKKSFKTVSIASMYSKQKLAYRLDYMFQEHRVQKWEKEVITYLEPKLRELRMQSKNLMNQSRQQVLFVRKLFKDYPEELELFLQRRLEILS